MKENFKSAGDANVTFHSKRDLQVREIQREQSNERES